MRLLIVVFLVTLAITYGARSYAQQRLIAHGVQSGGTVSPLLVDSSRRLVVVGP